MAIQVGQKLQGKVKNITKFGAFVHLEEGQSGLVHISQVSNRFVKDINEVIKVGDEVTVKVITIAENGKIGLSIKEAIENDAPKKEKARSKDFRSNIDMPVKKTIPQGQTFDSLMSSFLQDSESRLRSLRRSTEGKRGGRGGRRS